MDQGQKGNFFGQIFNRPGPVLFSLLLLIAISLAMINILYNQPGTHPQPLWNSDRHSVTHKSTRSAENSVRQSKSSITALILADIPVPTLRPDRENTQRTQIVDNKPEPVNSTRRLQLMLSQLGYYGGRIDGVMGPRTMSAVRAFEQSKGLPQSEEITPSFMILLENAVNLKPAKSKDSIRDLLGKQERSQKSAAKTRPDSDLVTRVQIGLINFGNDEVAIDGVLDKQTRKAIRQFQARFKLDVNGLPSPELIRKLESIGALTSNS